ncbi:MAG: hypothetical protein AB9856_20750 [Cellulosilyticaceae bacterium]
MREKEIFRDCYNMLTDNLANMSTAGINTRLDELMEKYSANKYDQYLCAELISVIVNHLLRKEAQDGKQ